MKINSLLAVTACIFCFTACQSGLKTVVDKGQLAPKFEDTKVDSKYLWVRGIAAANPMHNSRTQRRAMSREAAIANAYQRAVEFVKGSGVIANVRVVDAVSKDSVLETKVNGIIRGGEVFSSEYMDDDGCTVIMRISKDRLEAMEIELFESSD